ncbi:hypothetical protein [Sphingopyxis panaciterrae]
MSGHARGGGAATDGLLELKQHLDVASIAELIAKTARWVDPATFRELPLWYPEHARRSPLYNAGWTERRQNRNRTSKEISDKYEGNTHANTALSLALGYRKRDRPNWSCCHIWGVDDARYMRSNAVVQDHRFFSCVGNMVLLPSPLKAFTDVMPEIKAMLRRCASDLYGWSCDHPDAPPLPKSAYRAADYPACWRGAAKGKVPGLVFISPGIRKSIVARKAAIARDLQQAGEFYPRDAVRAALAYWKIDL